MGSFVFIQNFHFFQNIFFQKSLSNEYKMQKWNNQSLYEDENIHIIFDSLQWCYNYFYFIDSFTFL